MISSQFFNSTQQFVFRKWSSWDYKNDEDGNVEVDCTASSRLVRDVGGGLYNDDDRGPDGGGDEDNHSLDHAG